MEARQQQGGFRTSWGWGSLVVGVLAAGIGAFAERKCRSRRQGRPRRPSRRQRSKPRPWQRWRGSILLPWPKTSHGWRPWLAPLAARLGGGGRIPLVVALSSPPTPEALEVIRAAAPRRMILLTVADKPKLGPQLSRFSPQALGNWRDPVQGSFATAKRFWIRPKRAVIAAVDDAEGIVLGAALAARQSLPLLLRERSESRTSLAKALAELGVEEVWLRFPTPIGAAWASSRSKYRVQLVPPRVAQDQMIAALGAKQVHTIVVARAAEKRAAVGSTAWLRPIGPGRGARRGLDPCRQCGGRRGRRGASDPPAWAATANDHSPGRLRFDRRQFRRDRERIRGGPLLAPTAARRLREKYQLNTEPFVPTEASKAASFGVGRIPLQSLGDASVLFARGLLRQRMAEDRASPVLLIANSGPPAAPCRCARRSAA